MRVPALSETTAALCFLLHAPHSLRRGRSGSDQRRIGALPQCGSFHAERALPHRVAAGWFTSLSARHGREERDNRRSRCMRPAKIGTGSAPEASSYAAGTGRMVLARGALRIDERRAWPRSSRWAAAPTAGVWAPAARPPSCSPAGPIRCLRIGRGAADGSRNWAFIDSGGAGVIQVVGGLTALPSPGSWVHGAASSTPMGCRRRCPVTTLFSFCWAVSLAWLGWLGLNGAGAILFTGVEASRAVLIAVNTAFAAGSAALSRGCHHARAFWQDRRIAVRQWLGGGTGRDKRGLRFGAPGCCCDHRIGGGRVGGLFGGVAGAAPVRSTIQAAPISVHAVAGIMGIVGDRILGRHYARVAGWRNWSASPRCSDLFCR